MRRRAKAKTLKKLGKKLPKWSDFQNDFLGFAALVYILDETGALRKFVPTRIQAHFCKHRTKRDIVLKPRQIGFTTLELIRDLWRLVCFSGSRVALVVQSSTDHKPVKQIAEIVERMILGLRETGIPIHFTAQSTDGWVIGGTGSSFRIIEAGASELAAEKKGRSGTITRLHFTEAAFYEYAEQTMNALLACVPSVEFDTEIVIESTANGASGDFHGRYQMAKQTKGNFKAHFYMWLMKDEYRAPLKPGERIKQANKREEQLVKLGATPEQIKWYRGKIADSNGKTALIDQEYPLDDVTCWIVDGKLFFDLERSIALKTAATKPVRFESVGEGDLRIFEEPRTDAEYIVVADPSEGIEGDPAGAAVYDTTTGGHVATLRGNYRPAIFAGYLAMVGTLYNSAAIVVERNNHGHAVIQALEHGIKNALEPYDHLFVSQHDKRFGWLNTSVTRAAALDGLQGAHFRGEYTTPDEETVDELLSFVSKNGKPQARAGAHDELVIVAAIAHDVLTHALPDRYQGGSMSRTSSR